MPILLMLVVVIKQQIDYTIFSPILYEYMDFLQNDFLQNKERAALSRFFPVYNH